MNAKPIKTKVKKDINASPSLCDCYSISLETVSENKDDDLICYSYLMKYDNDNNECKFSAKSIVFGVCDNNDYDLTEQTLETSVININPKQQLFKSYKSDSFLGLNVEKFDNDKVMICLQNQEEISFITSNNVQLMLDNNDMVTCHNDGKQNGLPCFHNYKNRKPTNNTKTIRTRTRIRIQIHHFLMPIYNHSMKMF